MFFFKRISVRPNHIGYLYQNNQFKKKLTSGVYTFFHFFSKIDCVMLPTISQNFSVVNQEVLTKDNIALRFSYIIEYKISDESVFLSRFDILQKRLNLIGEAEKIIHYSSQFFLRQIIRQMDSQHLNEKHQEITEKIPEGLNEELTSYGLKIKRLRVRDLSFPKMIQELFAKQLEAKIRAKTELENARTTVATARALKNASEIMKNDENIKFLKYLEAITQIASKGKHTFVIGELESNHGQIKS